MPTIGTKYRAKPRVRIRKGHSPVDPSNLVESFAAKADADIKSGMLVCKDADGLLVRATKALLNAGARPYVAYADQAEFSVESSGLVPVIVCDGNYKVETAYIVDGTSFTDGDLIIGSDAAPGHFDIHARAANDDVVVGTAAGMVNYGGSIIEGSDPVARLPNTGINDEADPATFNGEVLAFYPRFMPVVVLP